MNKRKRTPKDRPVADRARQASEELEPGGPRVTRLATDEDADAAFAAGVTAAGESDRPAGTHVAPEHPVSDVPAEIDVDAVYSIAGGQGAEPEPQHRLEGHEARPDDPAPSPPDESASDEEDEDQRLTARPRRAGPG